MPEIKHNFTGGKMNKDLDERLVPNGQYRDAMNIQIRTTGGDSSGEGDAGTVQNIEGNTQIGSGWRTYSYTGNETTVISSVADEKNEAAYFFLAAPSYTSNDRNAINILAGNNDTVDTPTTDVWWIDSIIEQKINPLNGNNNSTPVVVDVWAGSAQIGANTTADDDVVIESYNGVYTNPEVNGGNGFFKFAMLQNSGIRPGMNVSIKNESNEELLVAGTKIKRIDNIGESQATTNIPYVAIVFDTIQENVFYPEASTISFWMYDEDRVLNFQPDNSVNNSYITGINIIDDLLLWTDGVGEPKKISISRCKAGTDSTSSHTKLYVQLEPGEDELVVIDDVEDVDLGVETSDNDLKPSHITVIRPAPKWAPTILMRNTDRAGITTFYLEGEYQYAFVSNAYSPSTPGEGDIRDISLPNQCDIRVGDILNFTNNTNPLNTISLKAQIISVSDDGVNIQVQMLSIDEDLISTNVDWKVELQQRKPLFELKLGRFAYRYKYEDGEYSSFSPWSELAFLPNTFTYTPSKGYNDGMVNTVRELTIKGFIPNSFLRPLDVKAVDILYKTTDDANVYVVKTITRELDLEWENFDEGAGDNTGSITLTSEMIHKVLPSSQTLRAWDNVPRKAVAQEIVGNRLIYGNYTQGYNIGGPVGLEQLVTSISTTNNTPFKSVKSLRSYKFGMVFGDKYGRETPVITGGLASFLDSSNTTTTGDIVIDKDRCAKVNKFTLTQSWANTPSEEFDYVKYYVKETSNEYYNLVMDRWYDAEDGNVWLSFPSADRNKVDEETYLILKNEHGSKNAVLEKARYKIIAIESEAPDYIKLDKRDMGKIMLTPDETYVDGDAQTTGIPDLLLGKTKISAGNWDDTNEEGSMLSREDFMGTKMVRVAAHYGSSSTNAQYEHSTGWKRVSRITYDNDWTPTGVILKEPFGNEVNMHAYFEGINVTPLSQESASDYIYYFLEFRDEVVENKPEFDGRFFVKVEKDDVLKNRVLKSSVEGFQEIESYDIAYIDTTYENPADQTNPGAEADYTWSAGSFTPSTVSTEFGSADFQSETFAFWDNWDANNAGVIFIDGAVGAGINFESPVLSVWNNIPNVSATNSNIGNLEAGMFSSEYGGQYNKPAALSVGNPSNYAIPVYSGPTMGQLTFSMLGGHSSNNGGMLQEFKAYFQSTETYFRFLLDPEQIVYKVINDTWTWTGEYTISSDSDYDQYGDIEQANVDGSTTNLEINCVNPVFNPQFNGRNCANGPNDEFVSSFRESIVVRFQRVNDNGSLMFDENGLRIGLNPTIWDPRGELKHDGSNTMPIVVLAAIEEVSLSTESLNTSSGCWETEPKEDVGLDIYHEASSAIPIRLNNYNIIPFTSPLSKTSIPAKVTMTHWDNTIDYGRPWVNDAFGQYVQVFHYTTTEGDSNILNATPGPMVDNIPLFSNIQFVHHDGTVTESQVIGYAEQVDGDSSTPNAPNFYPVSYGPLIPMWWFPGLVTPFQFFVSASSVNNFGGSIVEGAEVIAYPNTPSEVSLGIIDSIGQWGPSTIFSVTNPLPSGLDPFYAQFMIQDLNSATGWYKIDSDVWKYPIKLGWFNCYTFGNGVESNRIRDDYNAPKIDNGVKVSTTFLDYGEEKIGSGLIYSGLYNSTSKVNDLNEFNMAEKITKDLNPIYGSIQALKTRDTDIVVLAEDKVLKVLSNKDAVYNADGNIQLTATNRVLGTAVPFAGDYGISKNPESLAWDQYRLYFTDKQRGAVLRLSGDGLTPISNVGMKTWFRKYLHNTRGLLGTFDVVNGEYNITLDYRSGFGEPGKGDVTVSFNEASKGWVSFKSFIPKAGCSVSGRYWTAIKNKIWEHYDGVPYNTFYDEATDPSTLVILFNDLPGSIKSFKTINYEGSQAKINKFADTSETPGIFTISGGDINSETGVITDSAGNDLGVMSDGEYYNLTARSGWYVEAFTTDLQNGTVPEFIKKEGKWFNKINGEAITNTSTIDSAEQPVQGIGFPTNVTDYTPGNFTITIQDSSDDD